MSHPDQELRDRLQLKYIPFDADDSDLIAKAEAFFELSDEEKTRELETAFNEEAEFLIEIMTARALYKDPVDRDPGSITEEKVRAYPERYDWKPSYEA